MCVETANPKNSDTKHRTKKKLRKITDSERKEKIQILS